MEMEGLLMAEMDSDSKLLRFPYDPTDVKYMNKKKIHNLFKLDFFISKVRTSDFFQHSFNT